jgi:RHS repeat-associated protein
VLNYRNITKTAQTAETSATTSQLTTINNRNQYSTFAGQTLSYDPNGNLTSKDGTTIQYDFENHLKKATTAEGTIVENMYDATGRKVQEKATVAGAAHSTDYALVGDQVLEEYRDASMTARYVRGRGIDEIVRAETSGTTLFPIQDELANVERLTDSAGTTLERYEYQRYGELRVFDANAVERASSAYAWRWLFQGRENDSLLRSYDFRSRHLMTDFGRFIQEDPRGMHDSLNRYQGFLAQYNSRIDPSGAIIDDAAIRGSDRGEAYNGWKAAFLDCSFGKYLWNTLDAAPTALVVTTTELSPEPDDRTDTGAVRTTYFDATGKYANALLALGAQFAAGAPDNSTYYPRGIAAWNESNRSKAFDVYSFGHELGPVLWPVLWPMRPTHATEARDFRAYQ